MSEMTAQQVKAEHVRVLGAEMGSIYNRLWNEIVQVRWEWNEYLTLFAQPQDRIDVLNEAAGAFFFLVQHRLERHVISSFANLADRAESGRSPPQPNLTVRRLPALAKAVDSRFADEVETVVCAGKRSWQPIRDWRHKLLAHLDLDVALDRRVVPIPTVGKQEIDAALSALCDVLTIVDRKCSPGADVRYDILGRFGGAEAVLDVVERAKRAENERIERIRTGQALREDLT
jgi:hypothetical protein